MRERSWTGKRGGGEMVLGGLRGGGCWRWIWDPVLVRMLFGGMRGGLSSLCESCGGGSIPRVSLSGHWLQMDVSVWVASSRVQ